MLDLFLFEITFYPDFQERIIDSGKLLNAVQLLIFAYLETEIEKLVFLFKICSTNLKYTLFSPNIFDQICTNKCQ